LTRPSTQSIADVAYNNDPLTKKIVTDWAPVSKAWGAPGTNAVFLGATKVDATQPTITFAQEVLSGKTTAKEALTKLQNAVK